MRHHPVLPLAAALAGVLALFAAPRDAHAEDDPALMARRAVQTRRFSPKHELRVGAAYLPQDPFYKAAGPELAYTFHANEWLAWEVVRAGVFTPFDTDLRRKVETQFGATRDPYEKVRWLAFSHVQLTPFYGRSSLLNRGSFRQEAYLTAGAGVVGWDAAEAPRADGSISPGGVRLGADVGIGFRFHTSRTSALRLETLYQAVMKEDGTLGDQFMVSLGGSFSLGGRR